MKTGDGNEWSTYLIGVGWMGIENWFQSKPLV